MEARFEKPESWPQSAQQAEQLRQELERFVKQHLPPWVEDELLPRLNVLRWQVRAIWIFRQQTNPPPELAHDMSEDLRVLLSVTPDGCSPALIKVVQQQRERLLQKAEEHRQAVAASITDRALEGKGDLLAALEAAQGLTGPAAEEKRAKLRRRWLDRETEKKLALLSKSLDSAGKLPGESVQQAALLKVQDAVAGLMLDLQMETPVRPEMQQKAHELLEKCECQGRALMQKQRQTQDQKWRDYQKWALERILEFDSEKGWYYDQALPRIQEQLRSFKNSGWDQPEWVLFKHFPSTKQLLQEKLGVDLSTIANAELPADKQRELFSRAWALRGWYKDIDQELAYRTTRDGMVKFLLPINPNLLDPPLVQMYNKAFQKGWSKLEGRVDQLYVGQQTVGVPRKGLE